MTRPDSPSEGERTRPERPPIEVKIRDLDRIREKTPVYLEPSHVALGLVALLVLAGGLFAVGYFLGRTGLEDGPRAPEPAKAVAVAVPTPPAPRIRPATNGATRGQVLPPPLEIASRPSEGPLAADRRGEDPPLATDEAAATPSPPPGGTTVPGTAAPSPDGNPEICAPFRPCDGEPPAGQAAAPAMPPREEPPANPAATPQAAAIQAAATPTATAPAVPEPTAATPTAVAPAVPEPTAAPPTAVAPAAPEPSSQEPAAAARPEPRQDEAGDGYWPGVLVTDLARCSSCIAADGACGPVPAPEVPVTPAVATAPEPAAASPAELAAPATPAAAPVPTPAAAPVPAPVAANLQDILRVAGRAPAPDTVAEPAPAAAPGSKAAAVSASATDRAPDSKGARSPLAASAANSKAGSTTARQTWAVQARAFREEPLALEYVASLKAQGYTARVVSFGDGAGSTWYRVRLGRFHSSADAQAFAEKFNQRQHEQAITVEVP